MAKAARPCTIWIDLENTPHVPFFLPIVSNLERAGCKVILTARDFAQTRALAAAAGLSATFIGREYGDNTVPKVFGIVTRALRLALFLRGKDIDLAVGHGSRGLLLASRLLRIPSLTLYDYEGASVGLFNRLSTWVMTPKMIPFEALALLGLAKAKHLIYDGLKEDVYVAGYEAKPLPIRLDPSKIIVTVRPPSHTAHYRSDESFVLFDRIMQLITSRSDVQVILLARTQSQRTELEQRFISENVIIPKIALPGLDLLSASDLVIGGGGTVNREAAALGVPVVTIFKGPMGAVDRWLIESGKMIELNDANKIASLLKKRDKASNKRKSNVREEIVSTILRLANN
jgi:uncharacterized protein